MEKETDQKWLFKSLREVLSSSKVKMAQRGLSSPSFNERFDRIDKDIHAITTAFTVMKGWQERTTKKMEELVQILQMSVGDDSKAMDAVQNVEYIIEELQRKILALSKNESKSIREARHFRNFNNNDNPYLANAKEVMKHDEKLKLCVSSLSIFPDESNIKKRNLIYWWIGMGIVEQQPGVPLDEIGLEYFQKLLSLSFIRPYKKNTNSEINGCTMNPSICSLSTSIAKDTRSFAFESQGAISGTPSSSGIMYLSKIEKNKVVNVLALPSTSFIFNINANFLKLERLSSLELQNLTVLQLGQWRYCSNNDDWKIKVLDANALSTCFRSLKKLRYLGLQGISGIQELPDSLTGLSDLQVLDLRACDELSRLTSFEEENQHSKSSIANLSKLTHLDVSECYLLKSLPAGISDLSELQVLKGFMMGYFDDFNAPDIICNIAKWNRLSKLGINFSSTISMTEVDVSAMKNLMSLSTLTISWADYVPKNAGEAALRLDWLPDSLKKLDFHCFPLEELPQSGFIASKLKNLRKLYFRGGKLQNIWNVAKNGSLPHLTVLRLRYLKQFNMLSLSFLKDNFPNLQILDTTECPLSAKSFFDTTYHGKIALLVYLLVYPENTTIKKSHYAYWLISNGSKSYSEADDLAGTVIRGLWMDGLVKPHNRKGSSIVQSCTLTLRPAYIRSMAVQLAQELGYLGFDSIGTPLEKSRVTTLCVSSTIKFEPLSLFNQNVHNLQLDQITSRMKNLSHLELGRWSGYNGHSIKVTSAIIFFQSLVSLRNLRYLGLRGINGITEIPTSISGLLYLRILDLRGCDDLLMIHPNGVAVLKNLIYLDVWKCDSVMKMPSDFHLLTSTLEVMHGLVVRDQDVRLSQFNDRNLRKLTLTFDTKIEYGKQTLHFWNKHLRVLRIAWRLRGQAPYPTNCPSLTLGWFIAFLDKLDLYNFPAEETPAGLTPKRFPYLKRLYFEGGSLRNLYSLAKKTPHVDGREWQVEALRLRGLKDLDVNWSFLLNCFPSLKYANIVGCPMVNAFPADRDGIWLKESAIESTSSAIVARKP